MSADDDAPAYMAEWKPILTNGGTICNWDPPTMRVGEDWGIKITPRDFGLIKLIAVGYSVKSKDRPSLAHMPRFKELVAFRNEKQAEQMLKHSQRSKAQESLWGEPGEALTSLSTPVKDVKRLRFGCRRTRDQCNSERANPQWFAIDLPDLGECKVLRNVHPDDNIVVRFEGPSVDRLIRFLQHSFDPRALYTRREYASSGKEGVWKRGASYVAMEKTDGGWKMKAKHEQELDDDGGYETAPSESEAELPDADAAG